VFGKFFKAYLLQLSLPMLTPKARDRRQNKLVWQNSENNDDITALDFHPSKSNVLLCGGDDGQVSIFDTSISEEDDSLLQGVNHGPIHKAGFLGDHRFFALSSDQNLSIHPLSSAGDEEDPPPTLLGDIRPLLSCDYVIDVFRSGGSYAVAAGSNSRYYHFLSC
jgi:WD40 repeat protein